MAKAQQFLEEAQLAVKSARHDAAMLNSVHAAISATDAITVVLSGRRSADADHQRAADLLEEIAGSSESMTTSVKQLRALLGRKNQVEYESRRTKANEASDAVARAQRFVEWAVETVRRAKL
jgi:S-adenosylhomocysteine hydrolase